MDEEVGIFYYRARYYDPKIGRFISEDPIKWRGGINVYSYVSNAPVGRVDPFGLKADDCDEDWKQYYMALGALACRRPVPRTLYRPVRSFRL